jgi:hypothetical protein
VSVFHPEPDALLRVRLLQGETLIHVLGPGGSLGRDVSRKVLNTAVVSLGRSGPGGYSNSGQ